MLIHDQGLYVTPRSQTKILDLRITKRKGSKEKWARIEVSTTNFVSLLGLSTDDELPLPSHVHKTKVWIPAKYLSDDILSVATRKSRRPASSASTRSVTPTGNTHTASKMAAQSGSKLIDLIDSTLKLPGPSLSSKQDHRSLESISQSASTSARRTQDFYDALSAVAEITSTPEQLELSDVESIHVHGKRKREHRSPQEPDNSDVEFVDVPVQKRKRSLDGSSQGINHAAASSSSRAYSPEVIVISD